IGDGEELLPSFLNAYRESKSNGESKKDFLTSISRMTGVYVPSMYDVSYSDDGIISEYKPLYDFVPKRVERSILPEIETVDFPTEPIVPFVETVHDRSVVETFRGCTRGCRFCQAGMIYRPVRERKKETVESIAEKQLDSTGHEELSLLSLSTSDHSEFESMAVELMDMCREKNVSLSLPSLRLDSFSFKVLNEIQKYRKSGLTFAPEAGTQRLRDVINKGITEDDIYSACRQALELGWTHIKLYFMIGLPTETFEDLDGIADIARNIVNISRESNSGRRFNVTVSVSNFVPKAHTPFQWIGQNTAEEFREKHNYLREKLRIKGVTFHYHDDGTSVLEGILARGDRRVGSLVLRAYELGCKLDSWTEHFKRDMWDRAIEETGITPKFYAQRERSLEEVLPWDVIDSAINKDFLMSELDKAVNETTTRDCRKGCVNCGINRRVKCPLGGIYA
ncbi:MAG: TIGR03960 family B12-binding radical SAM protein, partial [Firmicutes bacterium]|nr:TIGR03960 family B12-binding radical SAM protein [Bacillota bacterium]